MGDPQLAEVWAECLCLGGADGVRQWWNWEWKTGWFFHTHCHRDRLKEMRGKRRRVGSCYGKSPKNPGDDAVVALWDL